MISGLCCLLLCGLWVFSWFEIPRLNYEHPHVPSMWTAYVEAKGGVASVGHWGYGASAEQAGRRV
jgi:hypothetical protein